MGKKKGKGRGQRQGSQPGAKKGDDKKMGYQPFAQKLRGHKQRHKEKLRQEAAAAQEEERRRQEAIARAAAEDRAVIAQARWSRGEEVQMSDEQLFEAALESLDPIAIERGKYGGAGPVASHVKEATPETPEQAYDRAERLFSAEFDFSEVERISHNLYVPEPPTREELDKLYRFKQADHSEVDAQSREAQVEAVLGQRPMSLTADQSRVLEDARAALRQARLREINVRQLTREVALAKLEANVATCQDEGIRYMRVITGKGTHSAGEPVLKRALVEWCVTQGAVYAPEILPDGTFGSFLLRLPRKS
jgi:DNA-nicking Smr family endonuclease